MKKFFIFVSVLAILCCVCCNKLQTDETKTDLYAEMVSYSKHFESILKNDAQTKSALLDAEILDNIDYSIINNKFYYYLDIYTKPENVQDWDESNVLNLISQDEEVSENDKIAFARSIAFSYYFKSTTISTKSQATDDCFEDYNIAKKKSA